MPFNTLATAHAHALRETISKKMKQIYSDNISIYTNVYIFALRKNVFQMKKIDISLNKRI